MKKEYSLLSYILEVDSTLKLLACPENLMYNSLIGKNLNLEYEIGFDEFYKEINADGIALSEKRVIFLLFKVNYRIIKIYSVYYFDNYRFFYWQHLK